MQLTYPVFNVQLDTQFQSSDDLSSLKNNPQKDSLSIEEGNLSIFSTIGKRNANLDTFAYMKKDNRTLLAVFDGHGDDKVSNYLKQNALKRISEHTYFESNPQLALKQALFQLQHEVLQIYQKGSTALIVILTQTQIIAANIGDSKLFGVLKDQNKLVPLTKQHSLLNQQQVAQIMSKGGFIFKRSNQYRINGQLGLARSIGDVKYKKFISSEPDVYNIDASLFKKIILATDGFYRHELFETQFYKKSLKQIQNKSRVGKLGIGFSDNATAICLKLKPQINRI